MSTFDASSGLMTTNLTQLKINYENKIDCIWFDQCTNCVRPKEKKQTDAMSTQKKLFLDVHDLGPGHVTAAAVADAHKKILPHKANLE